MEFGYVPEFNPEPDLGHMIFDLTEYLQLTSVFTRKIETNDITIGELARCHHKAAGHAHVAQTPWVGSSINGPSDVSVNANA
jgi:hypothetical protein